MFIEITAGSPAQHHDHIDIIHKKLSGKAT
jgi:hypothetical protein